MLGGGAAGFWSYVHADNRAERDRINQLAEDLREAYELRTGEPLELFVDSMSIKWGDDWEEKINEALAGTMFFIAIITPRFFQSQECRRELLKFAREAKRLGVDELLLPVYYVDVPGLEDSAVEDEAMAVVRPRHREDFRDVRLEELGSTKYRKAVDRLAAQLVERAERATRSAVEGLERKDDPVAEDEDDAPGFIERMAEGEKAFKHIGTTLNDLAAEVMQLGVIADDASEKTQAADRRGASFAGRLAVIEQMAKALSEPAERIGHLGQVYASELVHSDSMILAALEALETGSEELTPEDRVDALEFLKSIRGLAAEADSALAQLSELVAALDEGASLSRSLRKPLRRAKEGVQGVLDGKGVIEEWDRRASNLELQQPLASDRDGDSTPGGNSLE